jgi:epoxyqueuosine reductase
VSADPDSLRELIVAEARRLGFHRVGIVPVEAPARYRAYRDWVEAGHHGDMAYMADPDHRRCRADLRELLPEARAVVVVALAHPRPDDPAGPRLGRIAGYARGRDYHEVFRERLHALADAVAAAAGRAIAARVCVDSAPVLERDLAERAGIGFTAKNTMVIAPGLGSYILLGELLLGVEVAATSAERPRPRCGDCRACLDACPTGAFRDPFVLDARRCISYLTIEHRGPIDRALRPLIGTMIFGCDICQTVCPFNAAAPDRVAADPELEARDPAHATPALLALLAQGAGERRRYLAGSAMSRVSRARLARNVCIALGNAGDPAAIPALREALGDGSALVRGHAAWALGRLGATEPCREALAGEDDPWVREELELAIGAASGGAPPAPRAAPR